MYRSRGRNTSATPRGGGGGGGGNNPGDPNHLTFPTMSRKEIIQDMNSCGYPLTVEVLKKPTAEDVKRVLLFFVDEMYGKKLDDFCQPTFGCLDTLENPELQEGAVPNIAFYLQCRKMFEIAHYYEFGLVDLFDPTPARFLIQLSALANLHKFRGSRLEVYDELVENAEEIAIRHKEISAVVAEHTAEKNKLEAIIAQDEPKVAEYKEEVSELTMQLSELRETQVDLTSRLKTLKTEIDVKVEKIGSEMFARRQVQGQVDELKLKVVQSPERVKGEIQEKRERLDVEKENLVAMGRRTRELQQRAESLKKIHDDLENLCKVTEETTKHMEKMKEVQANIKAFRASQVEFITERDRISNTKSYVDESKNEASVKRLERVERQRNEFLDQFEDDKRRMIEETREVEQEEEKVRQIITENKKKEEEIIKEMDSMKSEHTKDLQNVLEKQKDVATAGNKFYSDMKQSMKAVGEMNVGVLQDLKNIRLVS